MFNLRPYQSQAVLEICNAMVTHGRVCLVMPTAAGKTVTALAATQGQDTLWIVHTLALKNQLEAQGQRVATVQSLLSGERPQCSVLIIDEAHHFVVTAEKWLNTIKNYRFILGLTATPCRGDGVPLGDLFNYMVIGAHYSELLAANWIAPCRVVQPIDAPENEDGLAMHPIEAWNKYACGRRGFAFFSRVKLAHKFSSAIPRSAVISGEQPKEDRQNTMDAFRCGDLDVLASVQCLSEGVDLPEANVALLARNVSHEGAYLQLVGRILRPQPNKTALLIDLPGASFRFGFPTDDREYSLTGQPVKRTDGVPALSQCLNCGAVYLAGPVCPECGWIRPVKVRPPKIWGVPMEEVNPSNLTPEQRGKMRWKEKMLADEDARLEYLQRTTVSPAHAFAKHRAMFGSEMPKHWWGILKRAR